MPPADPSQWLLNPYANDGASDASGRSARMAGRALAAGAIGLGAAAVLTGTGFADEGDSDFGGTSEVEDFGTFEDAGDSGDEIAFVESGGDESGGEDAEWTESGGDDAEWVDPGGDESGGGGSEWVESSGDGSGDQIVALTPGGDGDQIEPGSGTERLDGPTVAELSGDRNGGSGFRSDNPELRVGPVVEEFGGDADIPQDAYRTYDSIADGTAQFGGTTQGGTLVEPTPEIEFTGQTSPVRFGLPNETQLPVFRLSEDTRNRIDAERTQVQAGDPDARMPATINDDPPLVQVAPGVEVRGPNVNLGAAELDYDLQQGRLGATGISSDRGQLVLSGEGALPLDDRGNLRLSGRTENTFTFDPQSGQSIYVLGSPDGADPADRAQGLNIRSENVLGASIGTPEPTDRPTGTGSAQWDTAGVRVMPNVNLNLTNGTNGVLPSGVLQLPAEIYAEAGADNPNDRWNAGVSARVTPQYTFSPDASDWQTTTRLGAEAGFELGDRRDENGRFEPNANGLRPGSVVYGGVAGTYTSTDSGRVTVPTTTPGVTTQIDGDTTSTDLGGRLGFRLAEEQPRSTFTLGGDVAGGIRRSTVTTDIGSSDTGFNPYLNAELNGSAQLRTAPPDQTHGFIGVNAGGEYTLNNGATSYNAFVRPEIGGRINLGPTSSVTGAVGYQLGVAGDSTNGSRDNSGPTARIGPEFNLFGGRANPNVQYSDIGGDQRVQVALNFTPGGAVEAPRANPEPVALPAPYNGGGLTFSDETAFTPVSPSDLLPPTTTTATTGDGDAPTFGVTNFGTPTGAPVTSTGPLSNSAADLGGTQSVGYELTPAPTGGGTLMDVPPVISPQSSLPADTPTSGGAADLSLTPTANVTATAPVEEPLAISLDTPVVDIPEPVATEPAVSLSEPVASTPAVEPLDVSLNTPVVDIPEPVASLPEPSITDTASTFSAPEPVASLPEPTFSAPEPTFSAPEPVASLPEPSPALTSFDTSSSFDTGSSFDTSSISSSSFGGGSFF